MKRFLFSAFFLVMTICMIKGTAEANYMLDLYKSGECRVTAVQYQYGDTTQWSASLVYNASGKLTEIRDSANTIHYLSYDSSGNLKKVETYWNDKLYDSEHFYYNASGNVIRVENRDADGEIVETEYYTYSGGRLIKIQYEDEDEYKQFKYNSAGQLIEIETYWDEELEERELFHYHGDGRLQKIEMHDLYDDETTVLAMVWSCDQGSVDPPPTGDDPPPTGDDPPPTPGDDDSTEDSDSTCFINTLR